MLMAGVKGGTLVHTQEEVIKAYESYYNMVWKICLTQLGNEYDAYDATQETFMRFIKCTKKLHSEEHKKAWLIRTAVNYCKDVMKSSWKKKRADMEGVNFAAVIADNSYENEKMHREVIGTLIKLQDKYRIILYLYYYEGYTLKEIAHILKVNSSTLRSRFAAAKKMMKEYLENE